MQKYKVMVNPENQNSKKENHVFSNLNGKVDYHNIKDLKINNVELEKLFSELKEVDKELYEKFSVVKVVLSDLTTRIENIERKLEKYGY